MIDWHLPLERLTEILEADPESGLSQDEALRRLRQSTNRRFFEKKRTGWIHLLFAQFNQPLIFLLLFCAALSLFLYDNTDAFIMLIVILSVNLFFQRPVIDSLLFALALAVGLTPQLLPAIISINLAYGAKEMASKHVIVKRLASIENFGSMNILCCDKTGTLTTGSIKLKECLDTEGNPSDKVRIYACVNASLQTGYKNPIDKALSKLDHAASNDWFRIDEIPYDFVRKRITLLAGHGDSSYIIAKGSFQQVLEICGFAETPDGSLLKIQHVKEILRDKFNAYSNMGYRVLGVAYKLARHLASLLNLPDEKVLTGSEIRNMSDAALAKKAMHKTIFAEVEPNQKERLILALKRQGNVVGYLGDGINDVTALHAADVSISVDSAADAAKEAADIVLLGHELSILQDGVITGRKTFGNTLKYIFMATSANFGNMFSMAGASLFLPFLPLLPK
jgi:Mg2+-importing ATPase